MIAEKNLIGFTSDDNGIDTLFYLEGKEVVTKKYRKNEKTKDKEIKR